MNKHSDFWKQSEELHDRLGRIDAVLRRTVAKLCKDHPGLRKQIAERLEGRRVEIMVELEREAKAERRRGVA